MTQQSHVLSRSPALVKPGSMLRRPLKTFIDELGVPRRNKDYAAFRSRGLSVQVNEHDEITAVFVHFNWQAYEPYPYMFLGMNGQSKPVDVIGRFGKPFALTATVAEKNTMKPGSVEMILTYLGTHFTFYDGNLYHVTLV